MAAMDRTEAPYDIVRYNIWVDSDGLDRRHVITTIAALLGLDPRAATKLLDSGCPLKHNLRRAEARYLRARFLDFGLKVRSEPEFGDDLRYDPLSTSSLPVSIERRLRRVEEWFTSTVYQAVAGLVIGGGAWLTAQITLLPFLDRSGAVVLLMASCATGVFWGFWRPALSLRSVAGLVAVFAVLLAALLEGTPRIMKWFDSGRSSDYTDIAAGFLFVGLCTALAAPLSAAVVAHDPHGRARRNGRPPSAAPG